MHVRKAKEGESTPDGLLEEIDLDLRAFHVLFFLSFVDRSSVYDTLIMLFLI